MMEGPDSAAEMNNGEISSEFPSKLEAVDGVSECVSTADAAKDKNSTSGLIQCERSAVNDKELSWEKIAAEFTEDEEEDVKPEQGTRPIPETPGKEPVIQDDTVIQETTGETVIINKTVIEDPNAIAISVGEYVDEVVEDTDLNESEGNLSTSQTKEVVDEVSSKEETSTINETIEEVPSASAVGTEEVIVEEQTHVEEVIEIFEERSEDNASVVDTSGEAEYTVIEAEEAETHEIIEEHLAQTNNPETVVIINPDESQTEITIEQMEEGDKSVGQYIEEVYLVTKDNESALDDPSGEVDNEGKEVKLKKPRGRKPIADIPLHVLGRDITKPTEGVSNGGRTMPKPRLGVKVPYRNLTSQIVSKQEIEKEIMDRFKQKQEQNAANSGDVLFARKLTQRLAKKLIPNERDKQQTETVVQSTSKVSQKESEIKNNSDLIAILEGEDDDIPLNKQKEPPKDDQEPISKPSEKEIALQQLKELPLSKNKFFKNRSEEEKKTSVNVVKKNVSSGESPVKPSNEKKSQSDVEPRLKTGMVIKTYTRKRRSEDLEVILPQKKSVIPVTNVKSEVKSEEPIPSNVYVTKSSRVIKRKVIWDPDEVPSKSPIKSPRTDTPAKSPIKSPKSETPAAKISEKIVEKKIPVPIKKPLSKTPPLKKPKRLTEIDKLLMDEGAVNMLYDVKTNDEQDKLKKRNNKSVISLDKAHKELMSKTNVIKNDLQLNTNKDVQKSLRKKEIAATPSPPKKELPSPKKDAVPVPISRKKSKDSARSSVHSPPASPGFNAAEASRIIRRHSSSSFSSTDGATDENGEERASRRKSSVATESPKKKIKKSNENKSSKESAKNNNNAVADLKNKYKSFTMLKRNKLVSIKLTNIDGKHFLTDQILKDLTVCLKELSGDKDCHVVSLTSDSHESFCHGLDYTYLISDEETTRKKKANELGLLVKEFLRTLLNFPKVLVAGIQGDCIGLGVTMLPLFDMVIASDTSTFSTPYAKLECVPEAGFLLTVPHLNSNGLASELLYTSQVVKADDAFRRGLVTRLCWPEKYQDELKGMLVKVANQSRESIEATKQQLRHHLIQTTEACLNSFGKILIEQWTSSKFQKKFQK